MREIKFRAYDKNNRRGHIGNVVEINFSKQECIVGFGDPDVDNTEGWGGYASYGYAFSEVELMQFTGLTDRSGKEIYEGDIVQLATKSQPPFAIKDLTWLHGTEWEESRYGYDFEGWTNEEIEIIGNIYENSDLLQQAQK